MPLPVSLFPCTSLCCSCINNYGTEEQKQKFLRPLVDGSQIGSFGLTETNAGSDVQGAQQTVAVKDGEDWILNGSKIFTTNSGFADVCIVFALTDRTVPAAKGLTAFIVDLKHTASPSAKISSVWVSAPPATASSPMITFA